MALWASCTYGRNVAYDSNNFLNYAIDSVPRRILGYYVLFARINTFPKTISGSSALLSSIKYSSTYLQIISPCASASLQLTRKKFISCSS